jgi:hypothetical protein
MFIFLCTGFCLHTSLKMKSGAHYIILWMKIICIFGQKFDNIILCMVDESCLKNAGNFISCTYYHVGNFPS